MSQLFVSSRPTGACYFLPALAGLILLLSLPDTAHAQCTGQCVQQEWSSNGSPIAIRLSDSCTMHVHFQSRFCDFPAPNPRIYEVFFHRIELSGTACGDCLMQYADVLSAVREARNLLWTQNPMSIPYGNVRLRLMYPHCWQESGKQAYRACTMSDPCCVASGMYTQGSNFTLETPTPPNDCAPPCAFVCQ